MKIRGNVVGTTQKPEKVVVKATDLTEEQKAQARANIGAADGRGSWSASYKITGADGKKHSKWCRILNISRVINGTLNLDLFQGDPDFMVQNVSLDISGYVRWEGDTKTANPVIVQKYNNIYGVDSVVADPLKQSRIKKIRIAYPKRDAEYVDGKFPIPDDEGFYHSIDVPVYCYVDVLVEFDRSYTASSSPWLYVNYTGTQTSKCVPITEQTVVDDSTVGRYGEQLDFHEFELNTDIDFYMPERKIQAKEVYAENLITTDSIVQTYGLQMSGDNLRIVPATEAQIDKAGSKYAVITTTNVGYAVEKHTSELDERISEVENQQQKQYELIEDITLDEDTTSLKRPKDPNDVPYNFSAIAIYVDAPACSSAASSDSLVFAIPLASNKNKFLTYFEQKGVIATTAKRTMFKARNDCGIVEAHAFTFSNSSGGNMYAEKGHSTMLWENVTEITISTYPSSKVIPAGTKITIYGIRG